MTITLQQNATSDLGSALMSPNLDETDGFVVPEQMPPLMVLSLQSTEVLEITVTKTFLQVVETLQSSFSEITTENKQDMNAPFVVKNDLGKNITVHLESKEFRYYRVFHLKITKSKRL